MSEIKLSDDNAIEVGKDIVHRGGAILRAKNSTGHSIAVSMQPPECDALIAALHKALGRPSTPLEERLLALAAEEDRLAAKADWPDSTKYERAAEAYRAALAMAREAGPTVPRAAVLDALAPVLALHAQIAEESGEERIDAIESLLTALDETRATLEAAGLWPLPPGAGPTGER